MSDYGSKPPIKNGPPPPGFKRKDEFLGIVDGGDPRPIGDSGFVRSPSSGRPRYDLICPEMLRRLAVHLARGAEKYGERNWEKARGVEALSRYVESAMRHLMAWARGEVDEDHASAIIFNVMGAERLISDESGAVAGSILDRIVQVGAGVDCNYFEEEVRIDGDGDIGVDQKEDEPTLSQRFEFLKCAIGGHGIDMQSTVPYSITKRVLAGSKISVDELIEMCQKAVENCMKGK